jgi:hypothetical protein
MVLARIRPIYQAAADREISAVRSQEERERK